MSRFNTLLLREWMQYHRGWLILMLSLPVLGLLVVPFGTVQVDVAQPLDLMAMTAVAVAGIVLAIAALSVVFQAPGLARRDQQDRSIEFWLALPASHSASIGATVLTHFLLMPLMALAIGAASGLVLGVALTVKVFGAAAWLGLPWGTLLVAGAAALVRAAFGVLLAALWLLPLLLLAMAASAWLKRWGVALLAVIGTVGHAVLANVYGITAINDTVQGLLHNAARAMLHGAPQDVALRDSGGLTAAWLAVAPGWLARDAMASLADLAQPLFLLALLASAGCFALVVAKRAR